MVSRLENLPKERCAARANSTLPAPIDGLIGLHRDREPSEDQNNLVRLSRNERLQPLPESFMEILRESVVSSLFTNYPATDGLRRQLTSELGIAEDQLLLTTGSDGAIKALFHAYVRPGDPVMMLEPSYAMYAVYAQMFQARAVKIPFNDQLELKIEQLLAAAESGIRIAVVANPNQPTGTVIEENILANLADRMMSAGSLLAIDEAYYPFSRTTVLPWIQDFPNLLVTRTFSKAAGLAGLRVGYVVGHPEVIGNLYKVHSAHDVNSVAALVAKCVLTHPQVVDDYVAQVEEGGRLLAERVLALGLLPIPSPTNFMLVRVAHRCAPAILIEKLRDYGYLVKGPFSSPALADHIRVTLGPPSIMKTFADALERVLADVPESAGGN